MNNELVVVKVDCLYEVRSIKRNEKITRSAQMIVRRDEANNAAELMTKELDEKNEYPRVNSAVRVLPLKNFTLRWCIDNLSLELLHEALEEVGFKEVHIV